MLSCSETVPDWPEIWWFSVVVPSRPEFWGASPLMGPKAPIMYITTTCPLMAEGRNYVHNHFRRQQHEHVNSDAIYHLYASRPATNRRQTCAMHIISRIASLLTSRHRIKLVA
eukprot:5203288-Pyramimonas_sp.AAC.1